MIIRWGDLNLFNQHQAETRRCSLTKIKWINSKEFPSFDIHNLFKEKKFNKRYIYQITFFLPVGKVSDHPSICFTPRKPSCMQIFDLIVGSPFVTGISKANRHTHMGLYKDVLSIPSELYKDVLSIPLDFMTLRTIIDDIFNSRIKKFGEQKLIPGIL